MHLRIAIERDIPMGIFVACIAGIPVANTQGDTVEEARSNLYEVIELLRVGNALEAKNVN
jgi:predicted RNase H-like HicB family nuclease